MELAPEEVAQVLYNLESIDKSLKSIATSLNKIANESDIIVPLTSGEPYEDQS